MLERLRQRGWRAAGQQHSVRNGNGSGGGGGGGASEGPYAIDGPLSAGGGEAAPLSLAGWEGSIEAGIRQRADHVASRLERAEALAAEQRAAYDASAAASSSADPADQRRKRRTGLFAAQIAARHAAAEAAGAVAPYWVTETIDNDELSLGVAPELVVQLAALRRERDEAERALRFSAAMKALVASPSVECCICLDTFAVAAVMPDCLHLMCRSCMAQHAGSAASFRCPLCRVAISRAAVVTFTKASRPAPVIVAAMPTSDAGGATLTHTDDTFATAAAAAVTAAAAARAASPPTAFRFRTNVDY